MFERWKPIKGYEGLYEISDFGRVRSLDRYANCKSYKHRFVKGRLLKLSSDGRYATVCLSKQDSKKTLLVHRLVAQAFIPNPHNLPEVNHKSECKHFNHYSCLEWCDRIYNCNYGNAIENKVKNNPLVKEIDQLSLNGNFIKRWPSQAEIQRQLGFRQNDISACCCGRQKTAFGYIWKRVS